MMQLKPDKVLRDRFFTAESYQHPAKGHLGLWWEILERYTEEGETVLDPMAGVGATMLGALMGRNIICVELEQHFIVPMRASWAKMRQSPMLGHTLGQVVILRGDARALPLGRVDDNTPICPNKCGPWLWDDKRKCRVCPVCGCVGLDKSLGRVDAAVFSPPWADNLPNHLGGDTDFDPIGGIRHTQGGYTRPSAIITSPPFMDQIPAEDPEWLESHKHEITSGGKSRNRSFGPAMEDGYTRPVSAVITSPPYEGVADSTKNTNTNDARRGHPETQGRPMVYGRGENIGNLRSEKYWEAMRQVYQECHRVLRPGGLMVLVLKGFTRDGKYIDLPAKTRTLCEPLGFSFVETWQRELWSLSFWRILQGTEKRIRKHGLQMGFLEEDIEEIIQVKRVSNSKLDERLRFETVLVMRKL